MKLPLTFAAAMIAFAAPDVARATDSNSPVLEIVTFRLMDGADSAAFVDAAKGTEKFLMSQGAVVRRFLTVDQDGLWTDVVEWRDMATALSAAESAMATPEFAAMVAFIDAPSVVMRHASILWRMN